MSSSTRRGLRIRLGRPRLEQLLPLACLASAAVLFASELMTTFEFVVPGDEAVAEQSAVDQHGYALAVVATLAFVATLVAVFAGSKPAAIAVGVAGAVALLTFLIVDLPDAGAVGTLEDATQSFFDAEAVPRAGFWFELLGALGLAVSGTALATLTPEQLAALRPGGAAAEPAGPATDQREVSTDQPALSGHRTDDQPPHPTQANRHSEST